MDNRKNFITADWLSRPSTQVAPELIGATLVRQMPDGEIFRGMVVETEAYEPNDPACHAYRRKTTRNEVMFGPAGMTYVYLIYGMYYCLNIVTDLAGVPSAVLIRALQLETIPPWVDRLKEPKPHRIAAGPGKLCRALQIDLTLTAKPLQPGQPLWLEHRSSSSQEEFSQREAAPIKNAPQIALVQTTRIGLTQGAELPWRWYLANCSAVSRR